jgi:predicted protein tyrosine phosphatase
MIQEGRCSQRATPTLTMMGERFGDVKSDSRGLAHAAETSLHLETLYSLKKATQGSLITARHISRCTLTMINSNLQGSDT